MLLFLGSLGLALFQIGSKSILLDESTSVDLAHSGPWWLVSLRLDPNMRLHYMSLAFWVQVFGDSELAVRGLSALFGALAVVATCSLATRLFGRTAGVISALLLMVNAFLVQYSQNARSYTMLVFLSVLSTWFFVAELERPSLRNRIGYVLTSGAAVYAHFFAALVLLAHGVALVLLRGRSAFTRGWIRVMLGILLLSTPAIGLAFHEGTRGISWIRPTTGKDVTDALLSFGGNSTVVLVGLLVMGVIGTLRAAGTPERWKYLLIWTWLVVPNLASLAISIWQPVYFSTYLIICVPPLVLLGASGLARLHSPILRWTATAILLVAEGSSLLRYYRTPAQEDWRAAAGYVMERFQPGDGVVFLPSFAGQPFVYYVRRSGRDGPENLTAAPSWDRERIWLVAREADSLHNPAGFRRIRDSLAAHHPVVRTQALKRISMTLYSR